MGVRSAGHENARDQEYCSECGQPIPPAGLDEATQARHSQLDGIEPQAAVQLPPVSSPEWARASTLATSDAGGAAATPTARRPRSGRRPAAPASERSRPPGEPPTKPWYRKPRLVVPLSILAVVVAAASVGFGALLGGKSKSSATTQSPASTQSPESKKKQSPVSKWAAENQSKSKRLGKAMKAAEAVEVAGPNTSARRSICRELGDASKAAADTLPAPNAALTNALRAAFDDVDRAAQECTTAVERGDSAALGRFTSDFEAGQKQIGVAAYIVQAFDKGG